MGIPGQFNEVVRNQLRVFAAWLPFVDKYTLGDYGDFVEGVFKKLGNITEDFGVTFKEGAGSSENTINFASGKSSINSFVGSTKVDVIPAGEVNASVQVEFESEKSFLVNAPTISVTTIENVNVVGQQLQALDDWDGKWKVVYQVYKVQDGVFVTTLEAGTKLSFSGDASALSQMRLGSAGVNFGTNKTLDLKIQGKSGPIGLSLFRVKTRIFGGVKVKILQDDLPEDDEQESVVFLDPDTVQEA